MSATVHSLPIEIFEKVFSYLTFKDLRNAALVCHNWNEVLLGAKFQRCLRVELQSDFSDQLPKEHKKLIECCRNLSIVQDFSPAITADDDINKLSEPEENIASIIFSTKELNSLQVISRYSSLKNIIHDRLSELPWLKELRISFCHHKTVKRDTISGDDVWRLQSESLECFKLDQRGPNDLFQLMTPSLRELHLTIDCKEIFDIVVMYCKQLEVLRLKLIDIETLDKIMDLPYPLLRSLEIGIYDDKELQLNYSRTANLNENDQRAKKFVQRIPSLAELSVRSNVVFHKIFPTLCSVKTKLQDLSLHNIELDANILLNVLLVQPLLRLSIHHCEITNDLPGLHIRVAGLKHLRLINVVNNILLEHNFCGLKSLELFHGFKFGSDSIQKVFINFGSIEELLIHYRNSLDEDALTKLHQLSYLKSLTLRSTEVTALQCESCKPMLSVEKLTMYSCFMLRYSAFIEIRRVFPALKRLHVDSCHIIDDTSAADAAVDGTCELKLRQLFSQCIVSWHDSVQITPLTLKQLLL
ncbi:uncharacterized protein LOC129724707 [Wyeomyia smithii]|uniref:uncharacterized protein LOC129724707 n=1 Tax=Wyeomyia smithii TaxID=174621 RepID=UPI002467B382|nr:uncharacterized protein LOC129724707 [Wyeomyia smithii]